MPTISLSKLLKHMNASMLGRSDSSSIDRFIIDSRAASPGALFFAFIGTHADGHDFVTDALSRGATAAVVQRDTGDRPAALVSDTGKALLEAGRLARNTSGAQFIAVTGSAGKTTTKEIIARLLARHGQTHATRGNLNNLLGVPITLSEIPDTARFAVIEMGMNAPGEIDTLADITQPHVGVITNVGPVHLEGLGSVDGVRSAKGELLPHIIRKAVLPAADPALIQMATDKNVEVITFGEEAGDIRVTDVHVKNGYTFAKILTPNASVDAMLPTPAPVYMLNVAAAVAALTALDIEVSDLEPLKDLVLPGGRMETYKFGNISIIFDGYNANPLSFQSALQTVETMESSRLFGIFGDMLELGNASEELHRLVAAKVKGFEAVHYVGTFADSFRSGLNPAIRFHHHETPEDAAAALLPELRSGDLVLIKASRGIHLERALAILSSKLEV